MICRADFGLESLRLILRQYTKTRYLLTVHNFQFVDHFKDWLLEIGLEMRSTNYPQLIISLTLIFV